MLTKAIILCALLLACSQNAAKNSLHEQSDLYQHWIHSHEEDEAARRYQVYRPVAFPFPPARGRDGFEIREKGVFVSHPIAPGDGNLTLQEKWTLDKDVLTIVGETDTRRYAIVALSKDKLVLETLRR